MSFKIYEKKNPLALHAICETRAGAERWIENIKGREHIFMDKTLTADSFVIKEEK